ncbi:MAG: DUF4215 domain-containing protein [Polyangiales bacterium]
MSSLVFGVACGDDDTLPTFDGGTPDAGMADVPMLDVPTIDAGDPCMGVAPEDRCGTEGTSCDGDTLTTCAENATGCLVTTEADCSADGGTCDDSGAVAMCSSDPCMGVTNCDTEARSCDGDTLTVCALDAMGCLVTTDTDCAGDGTVCDDSGAMAMCVDACDGISDCDTEGRTCDGDTLNVCAPDAAGCLVNTATECAGEGAMCDDSVDPIACVPTSCPPATVSGLVLDCASGTIMGTTEGGSSDIAEYSCSSFGPYNSAEAVYTFGDAQSAVVTITAVRDEASTFDMDLFALEGGEGTTCGEDSTCVGSTGTTATETVTFNYLPGGTNYIVYDAFGTPDDRTSAFALTVECEIATCGDSMIAGPEQCDDGNADAADGCDALCQIERGYECTEDAAGLSTCVFTCGNSVIDGDDQCDDGNATAGDGCSDFCQIEDGYVCDEDGAGLSTCALSCGDSEVNGEDECDDGNTDAADGCSATCTIEEGYVCEEDGAGLSICEISCGNGTVDGEDECDDAGTDAGDGCSATCTVEAGYVCEETAGLSACVLSCGDDELNGDDECDDGNTDAGDGCSATCEIEAGFGCYDEPSICVSALESFMGEIEDTDTEWTRPGSTCGTSSQANRFEAVTYTNSTAAGQFVDVSATYNYDGFLYIFSGAVDPADPTSGCIVANDDFNDAGASFISGFPVPAGGSITIVVSSFFGQPTAPDNMFRVDVLESDYADCGDGSIDDAEVCDDGGNANGDGCSDVCTIEADFACIDEPSMCEMSVCGNSMVELGEVCDDGNTDPADGCEADCRTAVFSGSLDGTEDLYDRNGSGCTASGGETGVYQDVETFTWNGAADATLQFTVAWTRVDGFLHAYDNPFDSTMPLVGCLDGGDDFGGTSGSQVSVDATPAQVIDIVMSTYDPADTGDWVLTVTLD